MKTIEKQTLNLNIMASFCYTLYKADDNISYLVIYYT